MAKEQSTTKRSDSRWPQDGGKRQDTAKVPADLLFGKKNFMLISIGVALIFIGFGLMSGGHMPSPDVWDESLIYSHRRITIAPIFIIAGLILNVYAIFSKK
jgi:hypothetical protein